jgi:hypothetical protein
MLEGTEWHATMLAEQRVRAAIPCSTLLRTKYLLFSSLGLVHILRDDDTVDLQHAATAAVSSELDPSVALAAQLVLDAARHLPTPHTNSTPYRSLDWHAPLSVLHLPCLQHKVFRVAFWGVMNQKSKLVYVLSKTILQRCMTRKFSEVCMRTFEASPKTCETVKLLLLMSLLGNYPHSEAASRPEPSVRAVLYTKLWDNPREPKHHAWFEHIVNECPYLVEFALRDCISFFLHDDPAFEKHVGHLFDVQSFHSVVHTTTALIRRRAAFHISTKNPVDALCKDLEHALQAHHTALLSLSYRLPKTHADVLSALTSIRGEAQTNSKYRRRLCVPVSEPPADEVDALDEEAQRLADEMREIEEALKQAGLDVGSGTAANDDDDANADESKEDTTRSLGAALQVAPYIVPKKALRTLHRWTARIAPTCRNALSVVVCLLPLLGSRVESVQQLLYALEEFRIGSVNTDTLATLLSRIQEVDTLTYDLMQISVDLLKVYGRVSLVARLPAFITDAQFRAAQKPFSPAMWRAKHARDFALYDNPDFVYCTVCSSLYSMVREYASATKKVYQFGLRDAVVCYDTDSVWCWRNRNNLLGQCKHIALLRFSLFGVLVQIDGKVIGLCPRCCAPMAMDMRHAPFTADGPLCCRCAKESVCVEEVELKRLQAVELEATRKCWYCGCELKNLSTCFFYGDGVFLCGAHASKHLVQGIIEEEEALGRRMTAPEVAASLLATKQRRKLDRIERSKPNWKRQLATSKMSRNNKRR